MTSCVSLLNSLALRMVSNTCVDSVWDGQFAVTGAAQGVEVKMFARLQELTVKWIKVHGQEETSMVGEEDSTSQSFSLYRAGFWTIMTEQNV